MRKILLSAGLLLFTFGLMAQNNTDVLPQNSQDLIQQHFASSNVEKAEKEDKWYNWDKNEMYEVRLTNGIKMDFNKEGELTEIDSKNGEAIPAEVLPQAIRTYLEQNASNVQVTSWEKDSNDQEIKLSDGREFEFDRNGKFLKED